MDEASAASATSISDARIVALLREQPSSGLAQLYDRYGRLVFSVVLRIVHDHGVAEEVTQDVFVRCWRTIDRYDPQRGSLATWLMSIAHHRAIDELRSRRSKQRHREISDEELQPAAFHDPGIDDAIMRDEVQKGLRTLPDAQRAVIELIFWQGLTRREVADRLQLPLGTVHTRLRLGMNKLRELFGPLFREE